MRQELSAAQAALHTVTEVAGAGPIVLHGTHAQELHEVQIKCRVAVDEEVAAQSNLDALRAQSDAQSKGVE